MAPPELAINAISIVVRGAYNPAIFSPSWLMFNDLIGTTEYDAAQVEVVSPSITVIQADWLRLQATNDSFMVSTVDPTQFERTRDVAVGILQALKSIPVSVMGINREIHFRAKTAAQWHAIGNTLAPKAPWKDTMKLPGLLDLTILGVRSDAHLGRMQAQVQPSARIKQGVYIAHNDHYDLKKADPQAGSPESLDAIDVVQQIAEAEISKVPIAIEILNDEWEKSMERADVIIERIAQLATEKS